MSVFVTSDLHGIRINELERLLKSANFNIKDFLFILGDVIDRGKYSVEILKWLIIQPNVELILGNHEAMLLSCDFIFDEITEDSITNLTHKKIELLSTWMSNGAENTLKSFRELHKGEPETCLDIIDYLRDASLYETVSVGDNDFLLCHSGFKNFDKNKKLIDYTPDEWLWSRPAFDSNFFDDIITVFGHTPTMSYDHANKGKILKTKTWIDIDVGVPYGNPPALLRLDDLKEFYL